MSKFIIGLHTEAGWSFLAERTAGTSADEAARRQRPLCALWCVARPKGNEAFLHRGWTLRCGDPGQVRVEKYNWDWGIEYFLLCI